VPPTPEPKGVLLAPTAPPIGGKLRTIAVDPGHGGPETGSAPSDDLIEKDVNLKIALALADLLREEGFRVVLTRDTDRAVSPNYRNSGVRSQVVQDLQARVEVANAAGAELFLSIHNNGSGDPSARGTEVWYNAARPFADRNLTLAELVLENVLRQLRAAGHSAVDRGVKDDANFRIWNGRAFNLFVLGPGPGYRPATKMPGALGETLFLTNPADAAALRRPAIVQAIVRGYRDAVLRYLEKYPDPVEGSPLSS
jgi:N-acetylmuramoyl-L-alanine amidase